MALGQAAGITAALAIDKGVKVRNVDIPSLQDILIKQKATLIYFRDVKPTDDAFPLVQYLGLRGYLPDWNASLQQPIDESTLRNWSNLCGTQLKATPGQTTRLKVLTDIYKLQSERTGLF